MQKVGPSTHENEFMRLWYDGPKDARKLIERYPIAALVSLVVLSLLGLMLVFSFSITCIASGLLFMGASYGIGRTMAMDCSSYWKRFLSNLGKILLSNDYSEVPEIESEKPLPNVHKPSTPVKA